MLLKLNFLVSGTLIVGALDMIGDKSFFTSLENYDGGVVTFRDRNLAKVKGKGSIVIPSCPKLDEVLYVARLKANLLSISQMWDKDHKVNFHQDLCEVVNKERNVVITRHGIVNFKTPFMYSRAKLNPIELWHRRLIHINYRDFMHLVNIEKNRRIPKLSGEPKPICCECMKGKQTKSSHKKCKEIRTIRPLDLLHMDLMGPIVDPHFSRVSSLNWRDIFY